MNDKLEIKKEINNDISIQEVKSLYFDEILIQESGISLRRLDYKGHRNYFTIDGNNQLHNLYTSVTTFTKSVLPTSPFLLQWMKNKSEEEQSFILKSSATYGTLMDILFNQLIISGEIKEISSQVYKFTMSENLYSINQEQWSNQLKRDCLAFAKFIKDYDVRPILVSCPLASDNLGIAGTLDLLCEMNNKILTKTDMKKGVEVERINAIIDYKAKIGDMTLKSDRNSFYDAECLQLQIYKKLIEDSFFEIRKDVTFNKIDGLYNFSPKNWKTNPDYNLKCWNGTKVYESMERKWEGYYNNWLIDNEGSERNITVIDDNIYLDNYEKNFEILSLTDFINQNLKESENV